MYQPLVSIIVPIYNAEKYLFECINSIRNQSFRDFELILVNDGSLDKSLEICNEIALNDKRVVVLDKENGGVSSARNLGIESSSGVYITFIDSDDLVDKHYLERLISQGADDVDIIQSGLYFFDDRTGNRIGEEVLPDLVLVENKADDFFKIATFPLITSPVAKLYRRRIIIENNVRFDEGLSYGEDRDFNLKYIRHIQKSVSIGYVGYYYRKGLDGNLSSLKNYLHLLNCDLEYWDKLKCLFDSKQYEGNAIKEYLANRLFNFYNDRLVQLARNKYSFCKLIKVLRTVIRSDRYQWLSENMDKISCSRIQRFAYSSKSALVIAVLLKLLR